MVLLILSLILSLFSCSNEVIPEEREIYIVTVADDFYNYNGNGRKLENVVTDQAALSMQFQTLLLMQNLYAGQRIIRKICLTEQWKVIQLQIRRIVY